MATPTPKSQSSLKHLSVNPPSSKVRVVLRVRPFLPSEIESNGKNPIPCITLVDQERHLDQEVTVHLKDQWTSRNECYKLDSFFGQDHRVGQIFHREVSAVIPGVFQGLNATIFAYGATGSGKTYTMQGTEDEPGLIPLTMSTIFSLCENTQCSVEISYYEVYMDRCYDLLEPKAKEIMALDDKEGKLQLKGLSSVPVHAMDEFFQVFSTAIQRRKIAHTDLNDVSSRSHGVLAIVVTNGAIRGKLNLIDLAGNEDNRRTCNEGIRLQESAKINQSLFALSNVIHALNNNEPRIPYRESKLTRILQDSLGGTSRALMIVCLNPASYQEAVHTVSLAARSRQIANYVDSANKKVAANEKVDMEAKLRAWLESKGKAKSIQRMNGPFSPSLGKTPTSVNHTNNSQSVQSCAKLKNAHSVVSSTRGRRLFDSGAPISAAIEESISSSITTIKDVPLLNEEISSCQVEITKVHDRRFDDCSFIVKDVCGQDASTLHGENQFESLKFCKEANPCKAGYINEEDDKSLNNDPPISKDGDPGKCIITLHSNNHLETPEIGVLSKKLSYNERDERSTSNVDILKSGDLPGTCFNKEKLHSPSTKAVGLQELQNSHRKVLHPISYNVTPIKHLSSDDQICHILFEPKTPKTPHVITCNKDEVGMTGTPLDKFNALSSNLKESLIQEYLTFLNAASKEELLQLKGIGQKRADYILELRESSPNPLKSLSDLEKIGLSSRQVHDMFRRMARGIFT